MEEREIKAGIDLVRRNFEAFNRRDLSPLLELWTTDAEWRPAFLGGGLMEGAVYRGHEGLSEFLEVQEETWETASVEPVEIEAHGQQMLVHVQLHAVGRMSGIPVERTTWNVFEVRDGKLAAGSVYTNREDAIRALRSSE
jgi:ketosteroid isomerase-like protein